MTTRSERGIRQKRQNPSKQGLTCADLLTDRNRLTDRSVRRRRSVRQFPLVNAISDASDASDGYPADR